MISQPGMDIHIHIHTYTQRNAKKNPNGKPRSIYLQHRFLPLDRRPLLYFIFLFPFFARLGIRCFPIAALLDLVFPDAPLPLARLASFMVDTDWIEIGYRSTKTKITELRMTLTDRSVIERCDMGCLLEVPLFELMGGCFSFHLLMFMDGKWKMDGRMDGWWMEG